MEIIEASCSWWPPRRGKGVSMSGVFLFYQGVENGVDENEKHGTLTRAVSRAVWKCSNQQGSWTLALLCHPFLQKRSTENATLSWFCFAGKKFWPMLKDFGLVGRPKDEFFNEVNQRSSTKHGCFETMGNWFDCMHPWVHTLRHNSNVSDEGRGRRIYKLTFLPEVTMIEIHHRGWEGGWRRRRRWLGRKGSNRQRGVRGGGEETMG